MKIILPKTLVHPLEYEGLPLFFLAGPLRGSGDPHKILAPLLGEAVGGCVIAIPQRYGKEHPLYAYQLPHKKDAFPRQLAWEEHYLEAASKSGGILFWLGVQREPRDDEDPYAMDTRRELGEWLARAKFEPGNKVFFGAEQGFRGLSQIERSGQRLLGKDFVIHPTMEELAKAAADAWHA